MSRSCYESLLSLVLVAMAVADETREVTSEVGGFRACLPGKPVEKEQATPAGKLHLLTVKDGDADWTVSWIDLPTAAKEPPEKVEARLDGVRERMVERLRAKVVSEVKVQLDGKYPGRDLLLDLPRDEGRLRTRVYLAGNRLYQITLRGPKERADSAETDKVLKSFTLSR